MADKSIIWDDTFLNDDPNEDSGKVRWTGEFINDTREAITERLDDEHIWDPTELAPQVRMGMHKIGSAMAYYGPTEPFNRPDGVTPLDTDDASRLWFNTSGPAVQLHGWDGIQWVNLSTPAQGTQLRWLSSGVYAIDEVVESSGVLWRANIASPPVGVEPSYPDWALFEVGMPDDIVWTEKVAYTVDDLVYYQGRFWKAIAPVFESEPGTIQGEWLVWNGSENNGDPTLWDIMKQYEPGDTAMFNGIMYLALLENTGVQPDGDSNVWETFVVRYQYKGMWRTGVNFATGNVVSDGGVLWMAIQPNKDLNPSANLSAWKLFSQPTDIAIEWNTLVTYVATNIVTYQGAMWKALTPVLGESPETTPNNWLFLFSGDAPVQQQWSEFYAYPEGTIAGYDGIIWTVIDPAGSVYGTPPALNDGVWVPWSAGTTETITAASTISAGRPAHIVSVETGGLAVTVTYADGINQGDSIKLLAIGGGIVTLVGTGIAGGFFLQDQGIEYVWSGTGWMLIGGLDSGGGSGGGGGIEIGDVIWSPLPDTTPVSAERLICNGQLVDIVTWPNLYSKIGITWGGDGVTTFAVPDLQGIMPGAIGTSTVDGILYGDPAALIGDYQKDIVGLHDHTASFAGTAHDHTGSFTGITHNHTATFTGASHDHTGTFVGTAHTHVQNAHTHVQPSHNHAQAQHAHTMPTHRHNSGMSVLNYTGSQLAYGYATTGTARNSSNNNNTTRDVFPYTSTDDPGDTNQSAAVNVGGRVATNNNFTAVNQNATAGGSVTVGGKVATGTIANDTTVAGGTIVVDDATQAGTVTVDPNATDNAQPAQAKGQWLIQGSSSGGSGTDAIMTSDTIVSFSSTQSAATIQALIDATPHVLNNHTVTFQFGNGTYTLDANIVISGFTGGVVQVYGDPADFVDGATKSVILDFTSDTYLQLNTLDNCSVQGLQVQSLSATGSDQIMNFSYLRLQLRYCSFIGGGIGNGRVTFYRSLGNGVSNHFSELYGLRVNSGSSMSFTSSTFLNNTEKALVDGAVAYFSEATLASEISTQNGGFAYDLNGIVAPIAPLGTDVIGTDQIQDLAVTGAKIADTTINGGKLINGTISTTQLNDNAVSTDKIGNSQVTEGKIADNAVTGAKIASKTITNADIADNTITSLNIGGGVVGTNELADDAVTTAKQGHLSVTEGIINTDAVSTIKIQNGAVTLAKLASEVLNYMFPVGMVYMQLKSSSSPADMSWPGTWTNVSSTYAGEFFRAEGGNAAAYGSSQADQMQQITGSWSIRRMQVSGTTPDVSGALGYGNRNGENFSNTSQTTTNINTITFDSANSTAAGGARTGTETRPSNSTIRVWRRTA